MTAVARPREPLRACSPVEPLVAEVPAEGAAATTEDVALLALICTCEQPAARAARTAAAARAFTGPF
jgi:hypothetical protein